VRDPRWRLALAVAIGVLAADQATKALVARTLRLHETVVWLPVFAVTYVRNTGAAFGVLADVPPGVRLPLFLAITLGAAGALVSFLRRTPREQPWVVAAIGGILGGAVALRLRPNRPLVGAFAGWSLSALPALALLPPLPTAAIAVAYGVFQAGIAFGNNQFDTVLQREIPSHLLSRVDSFVWVVALGLSPVGQALAGPASEAFSTDAVLVTAAVLVVASCAVGIAAPSVRAITGATPAVARASGSAR